MYERPFSANEMQYYPDLDKVVIIYEGYKEPEHDFAKIARFAGIRLSNELAGEVVTVVLAKDKEEQPVAAYRVKNGAIIRE